MNLPNVAICPNHLKNWAFWCAKAPCLVTADIPILEVKWVYLGITTEGVIFPLLLTLVTFWIAKVNGFFTLAAYNRSLPVTFSQTLGAFLTYLIFAFLVLPILLILITYLTTGQSIHIHPLSSTTLEWVQMTSLWVIFFLLVLYCFLIAPRSRRSIFWGEGDRSFMRFLKAVGMGFVGWAISYPFVFVVNIFAKLVSTWIWGEIEVEQVPVKRLEQTMNNPYLFSLMAFAIIMLVPFVEELLFRGFLQNFLKRYLGRNWAIILTSAAFSLAHYAYSQGAGNFQLILSLGVIAFFLSFLYEREGTLWAPYTLHMVFNGFNVLMLIFTKINA